MGSASKEIPKADPVKYSTNISEMYIEFSLYTFVLSTGKKNPNMWA